MEGVVMGAGTGKSEDSQFEVGGAVFLGADYLGQYGFLEEKQYIYTDKEDDNP